MAHLPTVLLADNDKTFLEQRGEYLKQADYRVITACSVAEVHQAMRRHVVHVMLLDMRLENEEEPEDESGLDVARAPAYRLIPKIIITNYIGQKALLATFKPLEGGVRPVYNYVDKGEPVAAMLDAVKQAVRDEVRVNWKLEVQPRPLSATTFRTLAAELDTLGDNTVLPDEVEDLFRRLFYEPSSEQVKRYEQLRLGPLLWQDEARLAVAVLAFPHDQPEEFFVVTVGPHQAAEKERNNYRAVADALGQKPRLLTVMPATPNLAANGYQLLGARFDRTHSLGELLTTATTPVLDKIVQNVLNGPAGASGGDGRMAPPTKLDAWYRDLLPAPSLATHHVEMVKDLLPLIGLKLRDRGEQWTIEGRVSATFPNPIPILSRELGWDPPAFVNSLGSLAVDRILSDGAEHIWLTDYTATTIAPIFWNHVLLEASIRFDWLSTVDLEGRYALEQLLVAPDFVPPSLHEGAEPRLHRALDAVRAVRKLVPLTPQQTDDYHLGILFEAGRRLSRLALDNRHSLSSADVETYTHLLLAMGLICNRIARHNERGLRVENDRVYRDGVEVELPKTERRLFFYMWAKRGALCTQKELIKECLRRDSSEQGDYSQLAPAQHWKDQRHRLTTYIGRLRRLLGDNSKNSRYLHTKRGAEAYWLTVESENG